MMYQYDENVLYNVSFFIILMNDDTSLIESY